MTPEQRAQLESIVERYSRRYERPHAVVEAERSLVEEIRLAGFVIQGPERFEGKPYQKRYRVDSLSVEGVVDVPNTRIYLQVLG